MSKATSDILEILHGPQFHLDEKSEAEISRLAAVAENIWEIPSARVQARTKLAELYQEIAEKRSSHIKRRRG